MTLAASLAVAWAGRGPARRFDAAARDPLGTQQRLLLSILERNRDTEYGREFGFAEVKNLEDYRRAVPVVTWEDISERMERVARGEKNVMIAEDPVMFAQTSGTTGKPKLIPVTPTCQGREHHDQVRVWLHHARRDHRSMLRGKVLSMVSPAVEGRTEAGIPFGSTSGHMYSNMPRIIKGSYVVPAEAFALEDYDAEYYVIMRLGIAADVTFLCTANPSSIVKMCETAEEQADDLLRDLADGTLRKDLKMPEPIRAAVAARLKANPAKAKQLEAARGRRGGRLLPVDYWPRLALIGCWKGGTVNTYLDRFPDFFAADDRPAVPVRDWGYLSSEARGSVPLSDEGSGGVLTVASNVYEFVDVEDVDRHPKRRDRWRFIGVGDVKDGNEYYVFITTSGGLYRYDINDVIRVEGRYLQTPVIAFRRKGRGVTSITGEKISENQVIEAVQGAAKALGVTVEHFKAEADVEAARYVFKVEVGDDFAEAQGRKFLEQVEDKLAELNIEYAGKRKSLRLKPPVLHLMKAGWHDTKTRSEVEEGKRIFQSKAAVLEAKDKTSDDIEDKKPADGDEKRSAGDAKSKKPDDAEAERDEMVVAVVELDDKKA